MKRYIVSVLAMSILSGCVAIPDFPEDEPKDISTLSDAINCEIGNAYWAIPKAADSEKFKGWFATYIITRTGEVTNIANANPLEWIVPKNVDRLVFGGSLGRNGKSTRNAKVKFSVKLEDEPDDPELGSNLREACRRAKEQQKLKFDVNKFRLREWLTQVAAGANKPNDFSYSVTFEVTENVGFKPAFANGNFNGGSELSRTVKTTRVVDFTFSGPPEDKLVRVFVTNPQGSMPKNDLGKIRPRGKVVSPQSTDKTPPPSNTPIPRSILEQNNNNLLQLQLERRTLDLD